MEELDQCPNCKTSLIGDEIPENIRHHYGNNTNWKREISIYDMNKDRTVKYKCPDCKYEWSS